MKVACFKIVASLLFVVVDRSLGLTIVPIPKYHVSELSVEVFDSEYLDKRPVILTGATTCPRGLNLSTIHRHCKGSILGHSVRTKVKNASEASWAGLKSGSSKGQLDFLDFVKSLGSGDELRFVFDVLMVDLCPALINDIHVPPHFVNSFATQFKWNHMSGAEVVHGGKKCLDIPMYAFYIAEAGFESDLHIDAAHTAFTASMCEGRKRWRVMAVEDFVVAHDHVALKNRTGRLVNGTWVDSDIARPFDTWSLESPLNSLDISIYEGLLGPGEVIYIPPGAPHAATTLDHSLMVASNDQTLKSLSDLTAAKCEEGKNTCDMRKEELSTAQSNYQKYAPTISRETMPFPRTYGCEEHFKHLSHLRPSVDDRLEITPENFAEELQKGPMIVVKTKNSCGYCTRLISRWREFTGSFDPPVRFGVLHCVGGICPFGESLEYQVLRSSAGNLPELVYVAPSTMNHSSSLDPNISAPVIKRYYYGPRVLDSYKVWVSIWTGSNMDMSPWWWKAALFSYHVAMACIASMLEFFHIVPTADGRPYRGSLLPDGGTIALAGIVLGIIVAVLLVGACCYRRIRSRSGKKKVA